MPTKCHSSSYCPSDWNVNLEWVDSGSRPGFGASVLTQLHDLIRTYGDRKAEGVAKALEAWKFERALTRRTDKETSATALDALLWAANSSSAVYERALATSAELLKSGVNKRWSNQKVLKHILGAIVHAAEHFPADRLESSGHFDKKLISQIRQDEKGACCWFNGGRDMLERIETAKLNAGGSPNLIEVVHAEAESTDHPSFGVVQIRLDDGSGLGCVQTEVKIPWKHSCKDCSKEFDASAWAHKTITTFLEPLDRGLFEVSCQYRNEVTHAHQTKLI